MSRLTVFLDYIMSHAKRVDPKDYVPGQTKSPDVIAYDITLEDAPDDVYMRRLLVPKVDGVRIMIHNILRPDSDRHLHNHPWREATSVILSGAYVEERLQSDGDIGIISRLRGDHVELNYKDYHRIVSVSPDTWTMMITRERELDRTWGYLVDGKHVNHDEYRKGA